MVNAIGTTNINPIQMHSALSAFKSSETKPQEQIFPDVSDGIDIGNDEILNNRNIDEIKEFAKTAGEENLSEEDIKYGITYGRSVIADYIA